MSQEQHIELADSFINGNISVVMDELSTMNPLVCAATVLSMAAYLQAWHGFGEVVRLRNAIDVFIVKQQ